MAVGWSVDKLNRIQSFSCLNLVFHLLENGIIEGEQEGHWVWSGYRFNKTKTKSLGRFLFIVHR